MAIDAEQFPPGRGGWVKILSTNACEADAVVFTKLKLPQRTRLTKAFFLNLALKRWGRGLAASSWTEKPTRLWGNSLPGNWWWIRLNS